MTTAPSATPETINAQAEQLIKDLREEGVKAGSRGTPDQIASQLGWKERDLDIYEKNRALTGGPLTKKLLDSVNGDMALARQVVRCALGLVRQ